MWAPERTAGVVARPERDGPGIELRLLDRAVAEGCATAVWQSAPSLVVPASYRRHGAAFERACAESAAAGWPVQVRRSGGGLVPLGPGVVNLSQAWVTTQAFGEAAQTVYLRLCALLQQVIAPYGLVTDCAAVDGAFCDGRYNLALDGRKVVGTAQYWRRLDAGRHLVLAHACVLVDADLPRLIARANLFECAVGGERRYRLDAVANLAVPGLDRSTLMQHLAQAARSCGPLC